MSFAIWADQGVLLKSPTWFWNDYMFQKPSRKSPIKTGDHGREIRLHGPIELVDGEKLIDMFESLSLGLRPKKDYEIDEQFFVQFK